MPDQSRRSGFTLIELLIVIGIVVVLIGILIPVVGRVRESARAADTRNWITQLSQAIERYHGDFKAYPGPLRYDQIGDSSITLTVSSSGSGFATAPWGNPAAGGVAAITGTENLVLGLLGGLRVTTTGGGPTLTYDPAAVGNGPSSLNPAQPRTYSPYLEARNLSWREVSGGRTGHYEDPAGPAADTIIPEFVDTYPSPMPILYLRSRTGVSTTGTTSSDNPIITDGSYSGPYDITQIIGYTREVSNRFIGEGKTLKHSQYVNPSLAAGSALAHGLRDVDPATSINASETGYSYPYNAYPYFRHPTMANTPREKDRYILISAGSDRVYGTSDDITSFGDIR